MKMKRRPVPTASLSLTSMMDVLTILLVFLLKSFATGDVAVAPSDDLQVPVSTATERPRLAVNVVLTQDEVVVDGERVLGLTRVVDDAGAVVLSVPDADKRGHLIPALYERLVEKADHAKALAARAEGDDFDFRGEMLLQCDRRVPFAVLREVMFTAGQAEFGTFRFVVIQTGG